ncbi:MAG: hypothetical protein R2704_05100 [Microthrixaceae bacterium]
MTKPAAGLAAIAVALIGLVGVTLVAGASGYSAVFSEPVYAPSTSSGCAGSGQAAAPIRTAVDALDDPWALSAAAAGFSVVQPVDMGPPADPVTAHPTPMSFPGGISMEVSLRNVAPSTVLGHGGPALDSSVGALATVNNNGPNVKVSSSRTLQDCAPYPASLYGASAADQEPAWNENAGDGTNLNGVLFEFSSPVQSFGAFFADLETRGDTPAWYKLFDTAGNVIEEGAVETAESASATDAECGGASTGSDRLGCGNQGTRWLGWVSNEPFAKVLVTVGDDDSCAQTAPSQCSGGTEHLSWVGARLAVTDEGAPITTTPTTTPSTVSTVAPTSTTAPSDGGSTTTPASSPTSTGASSSTPTSSPSPTSTSNPPDTPITASPTTAEMTPAASPAATSTPPATVEVEPVPSGTSVVATTDQADPAAGDDSSPLPLARTGGNLGLVAAGAALLILGGLTVDRRRRS